MNIKILFRVGWLIEEWSTVVVSKRHLIFFCLEVKGYQVNFSQEKLKHNTILEHMKDVNARNRQTWVVRNKQVRDYYSVGRGRNQEHCEHHCGHKQSETKCSEINMRLIWVKYSIESSYYANMSCTFQLLLGIQILIWHGDCRKLDRKGSMRRHLMFVSWCHCGIVMTLSDPDDSEQSPAMLGIMLRTLRLEAGDSRTERMDPLLRELMVTALQRSQDERDRDNLTPPRYRWPITIGS